MLNFVKVYAKALYKSKQYYKHIILLTFKT